MGTKHKKDEVELVSAMLRQCVEKDLRIGQSLDNVFNLIAEDGTDPFFVTDAKFVECMRRYVGDFHAGTNG